MAIEHSDALRELEAFYKKLEPKLVDCDAVGRPVYAKPLTAEQVDKLSRYSGLEYNVRLMVAALVYADGKPVFMETDIPFIGRTDPAVIAKTANQITLHIATSFDALKNS